MGDPALGNLVDVPGAAEGAPAAGAGAVARWGYQSRESEFQAKIDEYGCSATSPRRAALDRGPTASGAIGGAPATNPSIAAAEAAAGTASRRTLAEAESPLDDRKSSSAGEGDLPQSLKGDSKRFLSTEEQVNKYFIQQGFYNTTIWQSTIGARFPQ